MNPILSRRQALKTAACGFGSLAMAALAAEQARATNPLASRQPHFPPRAKRIIFLFMQGGVSHVDSFDYKPRLERDDGRTLPFDDARAIANGGARAAGRRVMKHMWDFAQHGQSGHWVSSLFPNIARHADDLCVIRSLHTEGVAHGPSTLFLHCGSTAFIRPSVGSWVLYGLGSENDDLPGFISIAPSNGNGGPRNYGNAFLPAVVQGTSVGSVGGTLDASSIRNLRNAALSTADQRRQLDLLQALNAEQARRTPGDAEYDAVINSYDLGWRMQQNAPNILDLSSETNETLALYGVGDPVTDRFARQCLMARRMSEAGVRYIQVNHGDNSANPVWDQHSNMPKHAELARTVDRPIAALLTDLKRRGLLEDTLVWWGSEFGRTPYSEGGNGRDHNPGGFTMWLAGGGVKPGFAYGETDEFGHLAVVDKVHMHDMHATLLAFLGLDHERLTYRYAGRDFRLTDVHGHIVRDIMA